MRTSLLRLAPLALALAAAAPARAETKIAYVDMERALGKIDEVRVARQQLEQEKAAKEKQLNDRKAAIVAMQQDLQKRDLVLSEQAKLQEAQKIEAAIAELQRLGMQLQEELLDRESKVMSPLLQKIQGVIQAISDSEGFTVVLDRRVVLAGQLSLDITNEVIGKYNAKYPASGAPKAEPRPAAATTPAKPKAK